MKKIVFIFATLIAFVCANAQSLKQDKLFDETFIGATVGITGHSNDWLGMNAGLRVGKWFTPRIGMELEGTAQFNNFYRTILNHRVGINALANLNYLAGYKGTRHDCEFVPFVGIGWQRNYDIISNDFYTKMGLQININFKHGWQFNIIPQVAYNLSAPGKLQYNVNYMDYGIALGVTYNFKNSHGTHYFAMCDKKYTQAEFDYINAQINALRAQLEECQNRPVETITVTETVTETRTLPIYILPNVQFLFASSKISDTSIASLYEIGETMMAHPENRWIITGYASNEGSEEYNLNLSRERAEAVYHHLVRYGVDPTKMEIVAGGITDEYPEPCLNRVVVISQDF